MMPRPMESGVGIFATHESIDPGSLARLAEERGHGSLFFPEHTHVPAVRATPWPGGEGPMPRKYAHTYDLFVSMTAALVSTSRLRVGSAICLINQRHPIVLAKEVASLDVLSGGRVDFGVGAGWNREEMANHGVEARRRFDVFRERIEALKAIWSQEEATYQGEFGGFDRILVHPKPVQRPHPPMLIGGNGRTVLDRVLALGDVWFPTHNRPGVLDQIAELRRRADDAGRTIPVMVIGVPPDPGMLERYLALGVERVITWLPSAGRGPVEAAMECFEDAVAMARGT
jgi:probable F420-dependent oxidoreductase